MIISIMTFHDRVDELGALESGFGYKTRVPRRVRTRRVGKPDLDR